MNEAPIVRTIFVIDDDRDVLVSLRFLLETEGFTVRTFASGDEFLASDRPDSADCLVIDYRMTGMNGLQLVNEIRDRRISTPIIIITVYEGAIAKAAALGLSRVVLKPHVEENLIAHIEAAIRESREPADAHP